MPDIETPEYESTGKYILIDPDEGLETVLHAAVISGQLWIPAFAEKMFLTNIVTGVIM